MSEEVVGVGIVAHVQKVVVVVGCEFFKNEGKL